MQEFDISNTTFTLNQQQSPVKLTVRLNTVGYAQSGLPASIEGLPKVQVTSGSFATFQFGTDRIWHVIAGSIVTPPLTGAALTVTPDTNVVITPSAPNALTALLKAVNLAITWVGTLAISRGGTNSGTALNNNRVMKSSAGAIVENDAITANRAIISDANGLPVASVTTATEITYVNGVTSSIQTQLDAKQAAISVTTPITLSGASVGIVNQGTTTTVLHGNAAGNASFGAVSLTADVSGILPVANGGTGQGTYKPALVLGSSVAVTTHTGDTVETIFESFLIPANTLVEGDRICFSVWFSKTGTTNTFNPRVRINTSAAVGGTILYNPGASATNTVFAMCENKYLTIRSATVTQYAVVITAREAPFTTGGFGTGPLNTVNIDWTADQYLVITGQLGGSAVDTIECTGYLVVKY